MLMYISKTLLTAFPTLLILIFVVSTLTRFIPGTAIDAMLANSSASAATREQLREEMGLNAGVTEAYVTYLRNVVGGSLGNSLYANQPVWPLIQNRALPTIQLSLLTMVLSPVIGITVGLLSALRRNTPMDYMARLFVNTWLGIPSFVVATVVVLLPAYYFSWTPPLRYVPLFEDPVNGVLFFLAPVLTLATAQAASVARLTRTATLEVMRADYVRTAYAKGLAERAVVYRHVLRNALMPVVTLFGVQVTFLLSGTVVVEQVFSIPGLGTLLLQKIAERDWPVVQGLTLVSGVIVITINTLIDVLYGYINPRLRKS